MTSEGRDERSEEGSSKKASGERSDPRASESPEDRRDEGDSKIRTGSEATREQSERRDESKGADTAPDGGAAPDDDIPLNIAGHEDRESPRDSANLLGGDDAVNDGAEAETSADSEPGEDDEDTKVEPVEVLVQLADAGEIDPWDIDVVTVTDKFLEIIDESDLRTSGRALFYATVLIRMKSDAMLSDDDEEEALAEPWEQAMTGEDPIDEPDPFASLEEEMDRRLERRRARGMPQTLDELVRDLRDAERDSWWKESRSYDTSDSPSGFQRGTQELDYRSGDDLRMDDEPTAGEVTANTHAEDIDAIIDEVYAALREQYDAGREEVLFREIEETGGSRVETFLGLLFLSHRGQVRLQQDDLFGDLWVQDPGAAGGSEEALAD